MHANGHANGHGPMVSNGSLGVQTRTPNLISRYGDSICINNQLPKELMLRIFSYLDIPTLAHCAQVCRYWYELAFDGSNWKSINLFSFQKDVQPKVIEKIAQRSRGFLRQLKLMGCRNVTDDAIRKFAETCFLIEELELSGCMVLTDEACRHLGRYSRHLRVLKLWSCPLITDAGLVELSKCSELECLDVSWCHISNSGLFALANGCPELERLRCMGCNEVTSAGIEAIAEHCPRLALLNLNYCGQGVTDSALQAVSRGCPNLRVLCVSHCGVSDSGLRFVAAGCPHLTTLEVAHCSQITDAGLGALTRACCHLENVDLEDCILISDESMTALSINCPGLRTLVISHCDRITDEGVRRLASGLAASNQLESIAMDNCPQVTDASLDHLSTGCRRLSRVDVFDCQHVTPAGIRRLEMSRAGLMVHTYFAPGSQAGSTDERRRPFCRCCIVS